MGLLIETLSTTKLSPENFIEGHNNPGEQKFIKALKPLWETIDIYHEPVRLVLEVIGSKSLRCVPDFLVRVNEHCGLLVEITTIGEQQPRKQRQSRVMKRIIDIGGLELGPDEHFDLVMPAMICNIRAKDDFRIRSEFYMAYINGLGNQK